MKIVPRDSTCGGETGRGIGSQSQPGVHELLLQSTNAAQIQVGELFLLLTFTASNSHSSPN